MNGKHLYDMYRAHFGYNMGESPPMWSELEPKHRKAWDSFANTIRDMMISMVRKAMQESK